MELEDKYFFRNISLYRIRNRNELRVIDLFDFVLDEYPTYHPNAFDIQDIYALALNGLTPHYTQQATVVLQNQVSEDEIKASIRKAIETVKRRPIALETKSAETPSPSSCCRSRARLP